MKFKDWTVGDWFQSEDQMHFVYLKTPPFCCDEGDWNAVADSGKQYGNMCYFGDKTEITKVNNPFKMDSV